MTMIDWSKFDEKVDLKALQKDIEEAKSGDFKDVPLGEYEVKIDKMQLTLSKKGDPMVSIWFKVLAGEYENNRIFYNQVVTMPFQIHLANELLRSLESGIEVKWESYNQYANLIMDIHEAIEGKLEYALRYGENDKGYSTHEIIEIFEV